MTIAQRHTVSFHIAHKDMTHIAIPVLEDIADKLQQSCQLAVREENGFRVIFQSVPSESFYVNMPVGVVYQTLENEDVVLQKRDVAVHQPNPTLPDVTNIYAPVFKGAELVALLIVPCIKRRGTPSLEQCSNDLAAAAKHLSNSLVTRALVA